MNFIQEVLNLLERKQDKKKLDINRDYFEFGRTKPSSIGNPLYNPKMTPHAIKYKDFKCETIKGLISGTGTEHTLPVWSELDLTNCDVQTLIDSVYSQDAGATLGTVSANLLVKGDTTIEGDLLVLGKSTTIESTIVQIADNIIELNTLGADVNVGFTAGTTGGDKLFGWDSVNKYWSTFKEDFNTNTIIIDANIKFDNETIDNVVNQAEGLASNDNDNSLATVAAIKQYVDSTSGANTTYDLTGEVSNTNEFAIGLSGNDGTLDKVNLIPGTNITLTDNGSNGVIIDAAGGGGGITGNGITNYMTMWTGSTSIGNAPMKMVQAVVSGVNILTLGVDTDTDRVTFEATAEFQGGVRDRNGLLGTAGQVLKSNVSGDVSWADLAASPVMTSTVTGTGKLWDDTVQAVPTVSVSTVADRTYGVQFNDAQQLVVNVPWSGGGGVNTTYDLTTAQSGSDALIKLTGSDGTIDDVRLAAGTNITLTDTGNSITIDAATPVIPFTSLTTTGTSGAATLAAGVLNIPDYADAKFKIDAADTAEGYWSDKVTIGSGLSQSVNTDGSGVKTTTISAVSFNVVNSIKVGSVTDSGMFEFTGAGVTMNTGTNPTTIDFAQSAANVAMTSSVLGLGKLFSDVVQAQVALAVTNLDKRTYGVQFNSSNQLVVNIPWIDYGNWLLSGDLGPSQEISSNNTATIAGGVGLTTTASVTDTLTIDLDNTGVTAGSYSAADITVNSQGQITAASDGSAALGYLSYVAVWTNPKGQPITITILSNDTGCQWNWELSASLAGEYTISPSVPGDPFTVCDKTATHTTWVMANGQSTPVEGVAPAQIYFKNVQPNGKVTIELLEESNIGSTKGVERGNIEIRLYNIPK